MRNRAHPYLRNLGLGGLLAWCLFASAATQACTIFVLADTNRAMFCNNMDWKAVQTRIWFVPSEKHHLSTSLQSPSRLSGAQGGTPVSKGPFMNQMSTTVRPKEWPNQSRQPTPEDRLVCNRAQWFGAAALIVGRT